jgi:uncharacterized membrane protein YbaN (DUF454 family)
VEPAAIEGDGIDLDDVRLADSRMVRWAYVALGTLMVAIGVVGIVVPGLPTTVFLLMAAALYARSSERMYRWLLQKRFFGRYIRDWRKHRSIPRGTKIFILAVMMTAVTLSAVIGMEALWLRGLVMAVGLFGSYWVWFRIKTR